VLLSAKERIMKFIVNELFIFGKIKKETENHDGSTHN
jgi:hypothetical protein